jgi:hypothetical protein
LIGRLKKQTVKAKAAKQLTTYGTGLFFEDERTALLAVSSTGVSTTSVLITAGTGLFIATENDWEIY